MIVIILTGIFLLFAMPLLVVIATVIVLNVVLSLPLLMVVLQVRAGLVGLPLYYFKIVIILAGILLLSTMPALAAVASLVRFVVLSTSICTILLRSRLGLLGLPKIIL